MRNENNIQDSIMIIENFKGKKFEALTSDAMCFIVGGLSKYSAGGTYNGVQCSNDYVDKSGNTTTTHYSNNEANGRDFSHSYLKRACGDEYLNGVIIPGDPAPDPVPGDETYNEWFNFHTSYVTYG